MKNVDKFKKVLNDFNVTFEEFTDLPDGAVDIHVKVFSENQNEDVYLGYTFDKNGMFDNVGLVMADNIIV